MGLFSSSRKNDFPWQELTAKQEVDELIEASGEKPVLIFKHSTRCSISAMAKSRFESGWNPENDAVQLVFLDLLRYRDVSDYVAEKTGIVHQSPQAILIRDGEVIYDASHSAISAREIEKLS